MKRIVIAVNGREIPCTPTMGAMLRFKEETGREITEFDTGNFSDLCTYLWCCAVSACKREGVEFGMSLLDFADNITPEDMAAWNEAVAGAQASDAGEEGEKKSP